MCIMYFSLPFCFVTISAVWKLYHNIPSGFFSWDNSPSSQTLSVTVFSNMSHVGYFPSFKMYRPVAVYFSVTSRNGSWRSLGLNVDFKAPVVNASWQVTNSWFIHDFSHSGYVSDADTCRCSWEKRGEVNVDFFRSSVMRLNVIEEVGIKVTRGITLNFHPPTIVQFTVYGWGRDGVEKKQSLWEKARK